MATEHLSNAVQQVRRALLQHEVADWSDGQLLEAFVAHRDNVALEALIQRNARLVWAVCRRILPSHHDAEDAFQATFLVLVKRACSIMPRDMVGNWLYGVARRTALKARAAATKRRSREKQLTVMPEAVVVDPEPPTDLLSVLDRLPAKYRTAIVLCDLEGKTHKEAARQLGCAEGTLSARLSRARAMLAKRVLGTLATVPAPLVSAATRVAISVAAGQAATGEVAALTEGVIRAMFLSKLKSAVAVAVLLVAGLGAGVWVYGKQPAPTAAERPGEPAQKVLTVPAIQLLLDYQANEAAADEQFGTKRVRVQLSMHQARIKRLGPNEMNEWCPPLGEGNGVDRPYYVLSMNWSSGGFGPGASFGPMHLALGFGKEAEKKLAALKRTDEVTVEGQCLGRTTTGSGKEIVRLATCQVIEVTENKGARPGVRETRP